MASKSPIFRMFNPGGRSKEDTVEKRREQVRRAQHVYRQRKTRYIKSLEGDISTSRQRESQMTHEKKHLEQEVRMLLHLLDQHGIATPNISVSRDVRASPSRLTQSPTSQDGSLGFAHPEWPQVDTLSPSWSLSPLSMTSNDSGLMSSRVCDFDQTTLGMSFVLKIEEPCLGHVHGDSTRPEDPSGHALTVTSQLLSLSSSPPPKRSSLLPIQNNPATILDRLLELAPRLSSEEEDVTPVQAWDELRRKPILGSLDLRCVMTLAEKLRDAAKCHGFGAVVNTEVFKQLVSEVMASNISFGAF